jgi:pilus assembly protein CpaB
LKRSNRFVLLLGVALAAVAFVGVLALGSLGNNEAPPVQTVPVVVARADVALGTQLTADMLTTEERPLAQAEGSFRAPAELVGRIIRRPALTGHVLREDDFADDVPQANIASAIGPGLRAIAVSLDRVNGVGHLLQPGDRVDVVLTTANDDTPVAYPDGSYVPGNGLPFLENDVDPYINNTTVKVLVQNVQIVGLLRPPAPDNNQQVPSIDLTDMVTILAVTPQQVELVRWAQQAGSVSVVLRSPQDSNASEVPTTGITLRELVDSHGVLAPAHIEPAAP